MPEGNLIPASPVRPTDVRLTPTRWLSAPSAMARLLRVLAHLGVHVVSTFTAGLDDGRRQVDMILMSSEDVDRATESIVEAARSLGLA